VKESLGRNIGFVDAGDLLHFGLADTISVQDWIEDEVLPREHVAAHAEPEKTTHSNLGEDKASALCLSVQPLNHPDPPSSMIEDGCAAALVIPDKDVR
jgi:hypothetical protein